MRCETSVTARANRTHWPKCGARTRGSRAGRTCQADGSGVGGRCMQHGGALSSYPLGFSRVGPRERRQLVLISATEGCVSDWVLAAPRERSAWSIWAVPLDLVERLDRRIPLCGADPGFISAALEASGVARGTARRWPQRLGYRVVLRLAERGRIAFGLFHGLDLRRAARVRVSPTGTSLRRVDADQLLVALRAAGQRIPKGSLT